MESKSIDYSISVTCGDDIEVAKTLVYLYSASLVARGKATNILRDKLVYLTAFYIKFGYSLETKQRLTTVLGIKPGTLDHMNHELKVRKILVKGQDGYGDKDLNPELKTLQQCYKNSIGIRPPCIIFQLNEE